MNDMVLHVALNSTLEASPWRERLAPEEISVYLAKSVAEAMYYFQSYPMLAVLVDLGAGLDDELAELIGKLKQGSGQRGVPSVIGMTDAPLDVTVLEQWIELGMDDVTLTHAPVVVTLRRMCDRRELARLRREADPEHSAAELAKQTRRHLHDLSQPLSAVQGKLQLMSIKTPPEDPNSETYKELVKLIQQVSAEVMEVHQIQRRFS